MRTGRTKDPRSWVRRLAAGSIARGDPTGWFEEAYRASQRRGRPIPWVDRRPNRWLVEWLERARLDPVGSSALVVGCGVGDDAEFLSSAGFRTTAFDIAPTAVAAARRRFPGSRVEYRVADLFHAPPHWRRRFDLVVEAYTVQVLRGPARVAAIERIASFVRPGGRLLVVARARRVRDPEGAMPWPLTQREVLRFEVGGLALTRLERLWDNEVPPVRRFRAEFVRPTPARSRRAVRRRRTPVGAL